MIIQTPRRRLPLHFLSLVFVLTASNGLLPARSAAQTCENLQGQSTQAQRETRTAARDLIIFNERLTENAHNRKVSLEILEEASAKLYARMEMLSDGIERPELFRPTDEPLGEYYSRHYLALADAVRQDRALRQTRAEINAVADQIEAEWTILKAGAESRLAQASQRQTEIRSQMGTLGCGSPAPWIDPDTGQPIPTPPVPPRETPQASIPDTNVHVPAISSTATCAEAQAVLVQHVQAAEIALRSGNDDRGTLANMNAAAAMTQTICDREAGRGPDTDFASPVPASSPISPTATCENARFQLQDLKQAADTARSSGNVKQFRFALDNVTAGMAMTETICDREAATRPEPVVATPGGVQPQGRRPRGGQPTAVYPPAGTTPQTVLQPDPVYQPPGGGRTRTVVPPRGAHPKTVRLPPTGQTKTVRRPPPTGQTRTTRWPTNVQLPRAPPPIRSGVGQTARQPVITRPTPTRRCRPGRGGVPICDTR